MNSSSYTARTRERSESTSGSRPDESTRNRVRSPSMRPSIRAPRRSSDSMLSAPTSIRLPVRRTETNCSFTEASSSSKMRCPLGVARVVAAATEPAGTEGVTADAAPEMWAGRFAWAIPERSSRSSCAPAPPTEPTVPATTNATRRTGRRVILGDRMSCRPSAPRMCTKLPR